MKTITSNISRLIEKRKYYTMVLSMVQYEEREIKARLESINKQLGVKG